MARNTRNQMDLDFAFFTYLRIFYNRNRGRIKNHFRAPTKKFLDYNDPESGAYLWEPQFEALEMYIFIKEYLNNRHVHEIFADWHVKQNGFERRDNIEGLFGSLDTDQYTQIFEYIEKFKRNYPNYIFALPMGTGKTYLMATCIFYEFILANKFPDDLKYCHNALVFAPDKTVLQSLKKIQTFDKSLVVPAEYNNFLSSNVRFHFLEEAGTALSTIDQSQFNIIISNTQKIILKRQHTEKSASDRLFGSGAPNYEPDSVYDKSKDLYDFDMPEKDDDLATNQRFLKLTRLGQLGIFVDEAHHAFGNKLAADMGIKTTKTSLRLTIDELAANLDKSGTRACACYNFTGTPYVGDRVLPEVVYGYGLKEAIDKNFLKKMKRHSYTNPRSSEFVKLVITKFWETHKEQRHEGMLPKLAIFASTIAELQNELRPAVETVLSTLNIPTSRILVNVGDPKLTTNDELREFENLDTTESEKQFILLVNKGKEGWDCRSLFGVALYRKPRSKIFVLQASMRCLRQIGHGQQTGHIYLSEDNTEILENELQQNFRVSSDDLEGAGTNKKEYKVKVNKPPVIVKLKRIRKMHRLVEKHPESGLYMGLDKVNTENYRLIYTLREGFSSSQVKDTKDLSDFKERREFSQLTLCAEIARYLNRSPLEIEDILTNTQEGIDNILQHVNEFNELLYDAIIPRVFDALYDLKEDVDQIAEEIELVKEPEDGFYKVSSTPDLVVTEDNPSISRHQEKSFHLDTYAFDSQPEQALFWSLLTEGRVKKVYFTGMLTHGQSDFYIQYIDPDSHAVRRYYPDFLMQKDDESWVIVEVKGDNKIDDTVVKAKAKATRQRANASEMSYEIIKGSEANARNYESLFKSVD